MKSKSGNLILILVILLVVGALVYFFVIKDKGASTADTQTGLVHRTRELLKDCKTR